MPVRAGLALSPPPADPPPAPHGKSQVAFLPDTRLPSSGAPGQEKRRCTPPTSHQQDAIGAGDMQAIHEHRKSHRSFQPGVNHSPAANGPLDCAARVHPTPILGRGAKPQRPGFTAQLMCTDPTKPWTNTLHVWIIVKGENKTRDHK